MSVASKRAPFHVILLAGGSGTRFWPLSRAHRPKQLLPLAGKLPMLVESWMRVRKLAPAERIWVAAPASLARQVRRLLPELSRSRMIVEPSPRDTAPAIALACAAVSRKAPNAVVGIFPTDHVIRKPAAFTRSVKAARRAAEAGALVCLGVRPDRPATGYGYLKCARSPEGGAAVPVARFVEKPDLPRARRFLRSSHYLWNAGMFVWRVDRFAEELARTAPTISRAVAAHLAGREGAWNRATRQSVDYAVMERANGVQVVALDAGWDDVGSFDSAARLREERGAGGERTVMLDSPGGVVFGGGRLVALVDLPDVVVVDSPDALLVLPRSSSERVKEVVDELRRRRLDELL